MISLGDVFVWCDRKHVIMFLSVSDETDRSLLLIALQDSSDFELGFYYASDLEYVVFSHATSEVLKHACV